MLIDLGQSLVNESDILYVKGIKEPVEREEGKRNGRVGKLDKSIEEMQWERGYRSEILFRDGSGLNFTLTYRELKERILPTTQGESPMLIKAGGALIQQEHVLAVLPTEDEKRKANGYCTTIILQLPGGEQKLIFSKNTVEEIEKQMSPDDDTETPGA